MAITVHADYDGLGLAELVRNNEFECFASTGVNTPPMAKMTEDARFGN